MYAFSKLNAGKNTILRRAFKNAIKSRSVVRCRDSAVWIEYNKASDILELQKYKERI